MAKKSLQKNQRLITGWILTFLAIIMPTFGGIGKLFLPDMAKTMASYNLEEWTTIIGVAELIEVVLFLIPRTNIYGVLLLSAHMGGAIVVHMVHGESFIMQSIVLILVWLTGIVRNPSVFR